MVVVSHAKPQQMNVYHFKKGTEICNYSYSSKILSIRLNRQVRGWGKGLARVVPLWLFAGVDFPAGTPLPSRAAAAWVGLHGGCEVGLEGYVPVLSYQLHFSLGDFRRRSRMAVDIICRNYWLQ